MDIKEAFRILESASANGDDPNYMWSKTRKSRGNFIIVDYPEDHPWYYVDWNNFFSNLTDFFFGVNIK